MLKSKEDIIKETRSKSHINHVGLFDDLEYGQYVMTGMIQGREHNFDTAVGYAVQVRKKRGQFGSDQVLLRHANGSLTVHENQTFTKIPEELYSDVKAYFQIDPSEEGGDNEYTITGEGAEKGFLIEYKEGDPVSKEPSTFGITITSN